MITTLLIIPSILGQILNKKTQEHRKQVHSALLSEQQKREEIVKDILKSSNKGK